MKIVVGQKRRACLLNMSSTLLEILTEARTATADDGTAPISDINGES